ncbi:MAG: type II secretion system F family protein, partial [Rhodococcus sp. (in: high G+C Gram-positive bacteria)]
MSNALLCLAIALVVAPVGSGRLHRLRAAGRGDADAAAGVLPIDPHAVATTFDMLAACLRGGLPTGTAAAAVAATAPPV